MWNLSNYFWFSIDSKICVLHSVLTGIFASNIPVIKWVNICNTIYFQWSQQWCYFWWQISIDKTKEDRKVCFYEFVVSLHQGNSLEGITTILDANEPWCYQTSTKDSWEKLLSGNSLNGHSCTCKWKSLLTATFTKPCFNWHTNSAFCGHFWHLQVRF